MNRTFASIGVPEKIVRLLEDRGIDKPFPVQSATIPDGLAGRDVAGKAPTGSGKTLAFGIPVVVRVESARKGRPRALILAPTRELADQIKTEIADVAKAMGKYVFAIYGGVPYGAQRTALNRGVDVLVATPGRLEDLIEQRLVDLSDVDIVVVDEADRMADMGFLPAVRRILDLTSPGRQTLLFSATLDGDVAVLVRDYQSDPVRHEAGAVETSEADARHLFWNVDHGARVQHTADVIREAGRSIVFTRTRHGADRLARQLGKAGVVAVALHGGRSQNQRKRALDAFARGKSPALIATDVAARGIHIDAVDVVVHFDPPADHKDYLHRSGRTARAGATGTVISLVTREKRKAISRLQGDLDMDIPFGEPSSLAFGSPRTVVSPSGGGPRDARKSKERNGSESVFVGNLPWSARDSDLRSMFSGHGKVLNATVVTDRRNGRSKGFGFVEMKRPGAQAAVDALRGSTMGGRPLKVRIAEERAGDQRADRR